MNIIGGYIPIFVQIYNFQTLSHFLAENQVISLSTLRNSIGDQCDVLAAKLLVDSRLGHCFYALAV